MVLKAVVLKLKEKGNPIALYPPLNRMVLIKLQYDRSPDPPESCVSS